jgi:hypothetical protein
MLQLYTIQRKTKAILPSAISNQLPGGKLSRIDLLIIDCC